MHPPDGSNLIEVRESLKELTRTARATRRFFFFSARSGIKAKRLARARAGSDQKLTVQLEPGPAYSK